MDYSERIIVALDVKGEREALNIVSQLEGQVKFVKVGMELFYATGYQLIEKLKRQGLKIFLDLKMHDIPNTVGRASAQLTRLEVDMFNLHVAGGLRMMEEARSQMERALFVGQKRPLLIGVTQLTSIDERTLKEEIGILTPLEETVINYAKLAQRAGLAGVVSSPLETKGIKEVCGKTFITVTPGIRFTEGEQHDQKRVTTPKQAFAMGSDYIVIGRSITESSNFSDAFTSIIESL